MNGEVGIVAGGVGPHFRLSSADFRLISQSRLVDLQSEIFNLKIVNLKRL